MSEDTQPNRYNANKNWSDAPKEPSPIGIVNADTALYDPKREPTEPVVDQDKVDKPYKRVNYKKRYDDLKRHYDQTVNKMKELETNKAPKYEVPKTPEELATFKERHPEVYDTIETVAYQMSQKQIEDLQEKLNKFEARETNIQRQEAEAQLAKSHPDYKDLRQSPVFHKWVQEQPQEIQNWLYKSIDPSLASKAITLFKREVDWSSVPKNKNQDPSSAVKARSGAHAPEVGDKIWTTSEIKNLSVQDFDRYSKDIDAAYASGRVIKG